MAIHMEACPGLFPDFFDFWVGEDQISLASCLRVHVLENPIRRDTSAKIPFGYGPVAKMVIETMEVAHVFYTGDYSQLVKSRPELDHLVPIFYFDENSWVECMTGFSLSNLFIEKLPPHGLRLRSRRVAHFHCGRQFIRLYMVNPREEGEYRTRPVRRNNNEQDRIVAPLCRHIRITSVSHEVKIGDCEIVMWSKARLHVLRNPIQRDTSATIPFGEGPVAKVVLNRMEVAHIFYTDDYRDIVKFRPELDYLPTIHYCGGSNWFESMTGFTVFREETKRFPPHGLKLERRSLGQFDLDGDQVLLHMVDPSEEDRHNRAGFEEEMQVDAGTGDPADNGTPNADIPSVDVGSPNPEISSTSADCRRIPVFQNLVGVPSLEEAAQNEQRSHGASSAKPRRHPKVPYLEPLVEELETVGDHALAEKFRLFDAQQQKLKDIDEKTEFVRVFQKFHPEILEYLKLIDLIGLTLRIEPGTIFEAPVLSQLGTTSNERIFRKLQVQWRARERITGSKRSTAMKRAEEAFDELYPGGNFRLFKTTGKPI